MDPALLDRFRSALKATLWCWALYWPGGGILLLYGGLDPISIGVILGSLACFLFLLLSGALNTKTSRSMKELMLERPLYLVGVLIVLVAIVPLTNVVEDAGLVLFSSLYVASLTLAILRLRSVHQARGGTPYQARTDQAFIALGVGLLMGSLLLLDAILPLLFGFTLGMPSLWVASANWLNLLYPILVMLGTRGLREPLRNPVVVAREAAGKAGEPKIRKHRAQVAVRDEA